MNAWIALDIGGANLKAADGRGFATVRPFALWRHPAELPKAIADLLAAAPPANRVAVTMTGELADCFATKAEGVAAIVRAVQAAVHAAHVKQVKAEGRQAAASGVSIRVYLTDGSWATPEEAIANPLRAAASNWHALARFSGRFVPQGVGLLIDIGSTTCDVIPLRDGRVVALGRTDPERLACGELIYTGVQRSPICGIVGRLGWPSRNATCAVAQEVFATTWDAYLLLGDLPEEPDSLHTADGRPATREYAHDRFARMICADRTMVSRVDALGMAREVAEAQCHQVAAAIAMVVERSAERPTGVVVSGAGEFLARRALARSGIDAPVTSLGQVLGSEISRAATAHALAVLARETGN